MKYDIIGDIHGCYDELVKLLAKLGYAYHLDSDKAVNCPGRQAVFVGDLTDRGPKSQAVLDLVMEMVKHGTGLCVLGNHDDKLRRYLKGNKVRINNGLQSTIDQINECQQYSPTGPHDRRRVSRSQVVKFLEGLPIQLVLDDGNLVVAHAGLKERYHGIFNKKSKSKALYGETTGEVDSKGFPVRKDWAASYTGKAVVVHGHVRGDEVRIQNNVYNVDTSCVYGGKLTALRYPELEVVSVAAEVDYYKSKKYGSGSGKSIS
jgi:protein phosphatase